MKIPEGWPTREMIEAGNAVSPNRNVVAIFEAMYEAAPTPPAQEDEPVGFIWRDKQGKEEWRFSSDIKNAEDADVLKHTQIELVYTRPDTSELRKAAAEVLEAFKQNASRHPVTPALLNAISSLSRVTESAKTDE